LQFVGERKNCEPKPKAPKLQNTASSPRNANHGLRGRRRGSEGRVGLRAVGGGAGPEPHGDALGADEQARQAPGGGPLHRASG
jgi:hypothetical protein